MCSPAVTVLLIAAAGSHAEAETGFYVGATAGESVFHATKSTFDTEVIDAWDAINTQLAPVTVYATVNSSSLDKSHLAVGGLVGYRFTPEFAIEASYVYLGHLSYRSNDTATYHFPSFTFSDPESASANTTVKARGPTLSALGILPLSPAWEIYGRAGVFFSKVTSDSTGGLNLTVMQASLYRIAGFGHVVTSNSIDPLLGAGISWHLPGHVTVRGEYTRFIDAGDRARTGEFNIDLFNVGVTYSFR